jgi:hypothetical protein
MTTGMGWIWDCSGWVYRHTTENGINDGTNDGGDVSSPQGDEGHIENQLWGNGHNQGRLEEIKALVERQEVYNE